MPLCQAITNLHYKMYYVGPVLLAQTLSVHDVTGVLASYHPTLAVSDSCLYNYTR